MPQQEIQVGREVVSADSAPAPSAWEGLPRIEFFRQMIDRGAPHVPEHPTAWRRVRLGLTLILLGLGALPIAAVALGFNVFQAPRGLSSWHLVGSILGAATPLVLYLAGLILCAMAPRRHSARGLGAAGLALFVGACLCIAGVYLTSRFHSDVLQTMLGLTAALFGPGHAVFSCLFLRSVAKTVDRGQPTVGLTWLTGLTTAGSAIVVLLVASEVAKRLPGRPLKFNSETVWVVAMCLLAPLVIVVPGMVIMSLFKVRSAISAYLAP
jgi:hypothetical protein